EIQKTQAERDQVQESLVKLKQEYARAVEESQKLSATAQKASADAESVRKELTADRDRLRQELDAAMQLCMQRSNDNAQIASERDCAQQLLTEAAESQKRILHDKDSAAAEALRQGIASAETRVRKEAEAVSDKLVAQLDQVKEL